MSKKFVYVTKFEVTGVYTSTMELAKMLLRNYGEYTIYATVYGIEHPYEIEGMDVNALAELLSDQVNNYMELRLHRGDILTINKVELNS